MRSFVAIPLVATFVAAAVLLAPTSSKAGDSGEQIEITVLGDSLVAGYGLGQSESFPARLENRLNDEGIDVRITNAGVSGDTTAGGLSRLEWSVSADADGVIVELGANDALRGIEPSSTRANLAAIIDKLTRRGQNVLLAGMLAPPNMGDDYAGKFNPIYSELALEYGIEFYPFFLDGVAAEPALNQPDGIHPNASGVEVVVSRMLPAVRNFINRIKAEKNGD